MNAPSGAQSTLLRQPKAVWAVAFACVISFMGIGLVDPILPALSEGLGASPAQVSLLFTSYLVVTAVAMLAVGWVSSRIGPKWTLVVGLSLIVLFSALAAMSGSIGQIIGFRGGWGLGNALFIATSLAVIVASARGGFSGAIILYEAALGLGIAAGPLIGGMLGHISWRGPFFGVATLMFIALVATVLFIPKLPKPEQKTSLSAPIVALRHRGLLTMGIVALLYNWGFFTMLGYAPYPMKLDALQLGFVFTGWGLLVAAFAVFFAPRLQRRFGTAAVLYANLLCLGGLMLVIAFGVESPTVVIVAVILSGACLGINNTLTTQAVMLVAPVDRSVASSAYGFLRFIGGGLAPFVAGKIAEDAGPAAAFAVGAAAFLIAIPVLATGHKILGAAERAQGEPGEAAAEKSVPALTQVGEEIRFEARPVIAAIGSDDSADVVVDRAAQVASDTGAPIEVVHVLETDIVGDLAIAPETTDQAQGVVLAQIDRLASRGITARGLLLTSVGDHAEAGRILSEHAEHVHAVAIVLGPSGAGKLARVTGEDVGAAVAHLSTREIIVPT